MGNLKAFILAYIFAVVCFAESSADGVNNDVLVLQRLSTLERELHETRKELRESRIDHAKSTELLTREILDSRFEHESTTKKLVNELSDTRAELNALKHMFSEMASTNNEFNESSSDHKMPNAVLARASRQTGAYAAFTAYLDHTVQHLGIGQTIIFNRIHLNMGNAYNQFTGIFTCPVDGMYVFSFFICNTHTLQVVAELLMDNTKILHAIADAEGQTSGFAEVQGGNLAVVYCGQGSGVRVTNVRWAGGQVLGDDATSRFSSFSGFLLR